MHTIIPSMARAELVFGVMGAHYQPMGQSLVLASILHYGCDPQEAIDLPRLFPYAGKVEVEDSVPPALREALAAKGHRIAADLPSRMAVRGRSASTMKEASSSAARTRARMAAPSATESSLPENNGSQT
jgi:gamma-glutamyltranspeptidase